MSIRFQADADLKFAIVEAVRHREPAIDLASATDSDLEGMSDPALLDRSAADGRILITHDRLTMLAHFRARLAVGRSSPGLLVASQGASLGPVIDAILLIWAASDPSDWRDQAHHLPSLSRHVFPR